MAIKGKKKSQSRGSHGARRPAAAPRPTVSARRKTSWWRTRDGMLIGGIFLVVAIGVIVWLVVSAQDRAKELEEEREALRTYTTSLQPALESATPTATEMMALTALPEGDELEALKTNSEAWVSDLQAAQAALQQTFAPEEAGSINDLLSESIGIYMSAAQTFALVPDAEGDLQAELFTRATDQRDAAARVWSGAVGALDALRSENDLSASGLRSPAELPVPQPGETTSPLDLETPADSEGGGGEGSKKDGKKSDGKDGDAGGG